MYKFKPKKWKTADGLDNPDVTNGDRARWADEAVEAFKEETHDYADGICEENIADLLCDLMHLCDRERFSFDEALSTGRANYQAER